MSEPNETPGDVPLVPPQQQAAGAAPTQAWSTAVPPQPPAGNQTQAWHTGTPPQPAAGNQTQAWHTGTPPAPPQPAAGNQTQAWHTGAPPAPPQPAAGSATQAWNVAAMPPAPAQGSETRPWDAGAAAAGPLGQPQPPAPPQPVIDQQLWAGSLEQPGAEAGKRSMPPKKVLIGTGVLVVVAAAVGITGYLLMPKNLDVAAAQDGVQQILSDTDNGYGIKGVSDVKCNDGKNPRIKAGATFNCSLKVDGADRKVTVTFSDASGGYEVSRPQ